MRYIKEYSEYADGIEISDIEDCFRDLLDMYVRVKISIPRPGSLGFGVPPSAKIFEVSIGLDDSLVPANQPKESEFGAPYRPVENGNKIAELFAECVDKCVGVLDLEIFRAELKWVNAGEWAYIRKSKGLSEVGNGPGMMGKIFSHESRFEMDKTIVEKGDRLRHAVVYFA